ncbi:hypothetical protein AVEN_183787-1, partial [Araneus ventricosus]
MTKTRCYYRSVVSGSLVHIKSDLVSQTSSYWCCTEVWKGVPTQVSSSSSD